MLSHFDTRLFYLVNHVHSPFWDFVMYYVSKTWIWIPVAVWLGIKLYEKIKEENLPKLLVRRKWLFWVLTVGMTVGLANTLTSEVLKPVVKRYRPCREEAHLKKKVHIVYAQCGGQYGFASSHAANFFAMATLLSLFLQDKKRTLILFSFAFLTAYSRVYLGVHYPGDVFVGAVIGVACAFFGYWALRKIIVKKGM